MACNLAGVSAYLAAIAAGVPVAASLSFRLRLLVVNVLSIVWRLRWELRLSLSKDLRPRLGQVRRTKRQMRLPSWLPALMQLLPAGPVSATVGAFEELTLRCKHLRAS